MDLISTAKLLSAICVHYPKFRDQISNEDGKLNRTVVEEWYRVIGYLDYDKALDRFDEYLASESAKYAPNVSAFIRAETKPKRVVFHYDEEHQYHVINGMLFDEEEREYGGSLSNGEPYHYYYDKMGRICRKNEEGNEVVIA